MNVAQAQKLAKQIIDEIFFDWNALRREQSGFLGYWGSVVRCKLEVWFE
jgi:hypothetical protein